MKNAALSTKSTILPAQAGATVQAAVKDSAFPETEARLPYLAGYYPTSSPEDVLENTGFDLDVSKAVLLEAPNEDVIKMIREEIDPGQAFIKVPVEE